MSAFIFARASLRDGEGVEFQRRLSRRDETPLTWEKRLMSLDVRAFMD